MGRRGAALRAAGVALIAFLAGAAGAVEKKAPPPGRAASFTGCVDQEGEDYVLREPTQLGELAVLEPVGFPKEGLAKYVGQTVRVRGSKVQEAGKAKIRARSIETVSEGCMPPGDRQG